MIAPTLLALREEAFDEDDVQHAHAEVGVVDERNAALQELQHQRVVHLVEEDAQRDERVRQQDGRGLRLGVIPYPKPHGEVGEDDAGEEGLDAVRVVEQARGPHDGGELGAAVEEEVVGAVALLGRAGEERGDGGHERCDELVLVLLAQRRDEVSDGVALRAHLVALRWSA